MTPQALLEENTTLRQQNTSLSQEIQLLREQIEWFKRQLFASRSEKVIDDEEQLPLDLNFEELVNEAKELAIASHTRKKMTEKGKDQLVLPENIPVKTQILDLPEEEKTQDGKPLVKIGEEVSDKLAHSPGSYYIKRIIPPQIRTAPRRRSQNPRTPRNSRPQTRGRRKPPCRSIYQKICRSPAVVSHQRKL